MMIKVSIEVAGYVLTVRLGKEPPHPAVTQAPVTPPPVVTRHEGSFEDAGPHIPTFGFDAP